MATAATVATPAIQESPEALARIPERIIGERNARGIPTAVFVENVESFMSSIGIRTIEPLVGALQQLYSKYKFMETNLQKSRESFKRKIPETQKDLEMLKHLISKQEEGENIKTHFNLADNVYAKATVDCSVGKVCIWLGANVMVEYSYEEALELLEKNVATAIERLAQIDADLAFLRDQIITTEVNIARIFNHDVRRRRKVFVVIMTSYDIVTESVQPDEANSTTDWEVRHDDATAQAYYYNVKTGESSWEPPVEVDFFESGASYQQQLQHPWTEAFDDHGQVYYVNMETMETRWTPPPTVRPTSRDGSARKAHRPSTAEQMEQLNRLLSGDDGDEEGEEVRETQIETTGQAQNIKSSRHDPQTTVIDQISSRTADGEQEYMPWIILFSDIDGQPYYYNTVTKTSVWEAPAEYLAYHQQQDRQEVVEHEMQRDAEASLGARAEEIISPEVESDPKRSIESISDMSDVNVSSLSHNLSLLTRNETSDKKEDAVQDISSDVFTRSSLSRPPSGSTIRPQTPASISSRSILMLDTNASIADQGAEQSLTTQQTTGTPRKVVEGYDPSTGMFVNVVEPDEAVPNSDSNSVMQAPTLPSPIRENQLRVEAAILQIQCLVRCFMARRRAQQMRAQHRDMLAPGEKVDQIDQAKYVVEAKQVVDSMEQSQAESIQKPSLSTLDAIITNTSADVLQPSTSATICNEPAQIFPSENVEDALTQKPEATVEHIEQEPTPSSAVTSQQLEAENVMMTSPLISLPESPQAEKESKTSITSFPGNRKEQNTDRRELRPKMSRNEASTSTRAPQVLDISLYFPSRPVNTKIQSGKDNQWTQDRINAGIIRKKVSAAEQQPFMPTLPSEEERNRIRKPRQTAMATLKAQRCEEWKTKIAEYTQLYHQSYVKFHDEKQHIIDARTKEAEEAERLRREEQFRRQQEQKNHADEIDPSASVWRILEHQEKDSNVSDSLFESALSKVLSTQAFAIEMRKERLRLLQQRVNQLNIRSQQLEKQLDAVDIYLIADNQVDPTWLTFQAKYASKLRRVHHQVLQSTQLWQQYIDNFPSEHDSSMEKSAGTDYWRRVDVHYKKFSNQSEIQNHVFNEHRAENGDSMLHMAAWKGRDAYVSHLLQMGMDVNQVDNTLLRTTPLHEVCRAGYVTTTKILLNAGARLDAMDAAGDSPLHVACRLGRKPIVRELLLAAEEASDKNRKHEQDPSFHSSQPHSGPLLVCTLRTFFNLRNLKHKRAIDLVKVPTLREHLEDYDRTINPTGLDEHEHADHQNLHRRRRRKSKGRG